MTSIFSAVRLTLILIAIPAALAQASTASNGSKLMTGVELIDQINSTLAKHDINGAALVNPEQKFISCDDNLDIHPLHDSWKTLKLTCPSNDQWRLLVRVKIDTSGLSATQPIIRPQGNLAKTKKKGDYHLYAVALNRSMTKGEVITASDLELMPITAQQKTGIFVDPDDLVGRRIKTAIHTQKPIYSHQLEPYYMVEQKKPVTIAFSHQGIYVEMIGVSLENGQFGEVIKVENLSSGKTVFGKVIGNRKISPIH
jgi:flagella basal body P-ring formation protein FlgA